MIKRLFHRLGIFKPFPLIIHWIFIAVVAGTLVLVERHTGWRLCLLSNLIGLGGGIISVFAGLSCSREHK